MSDDGVTSSVTRSQIIVNVTLTAAWRETFSIFTAHLKRLAYGSWTPGSDLDLMAIALIEAIDSAECVPVPRPSGPIDSDNLRVVEGLATLGTEHKPSAGWQDRVLDKTDRDPDDSDD